jgi:hypothetical protein
MQFNLIVVLNIFVFIMRTLRMMHFKDAQGEFRFDPVSAITKSGLAMVPFFLILFIDAMKRLSKPFRVTIVVLYSLYVCILSAYFSYFSHSNPMFTSTGAMSTGADGKILTASGFSFESQISAGLQGILILMCNYIIVAILYPDGEALHFPLAVIIKKESVELMLELDGIVDSEVYSIVKRHQTAKRVSMTWKSKVGTSSDLLALNDAETSRREADRQLLPDAIAPPIAPPKTTTQLVAEAHLSREQLAESFRAADENASGTLGTFMLAFALADMCY